MITYAKRFKSREENRANGGVVIKNISICDVASYKGAVNVLNLGNVNIFYGANGSGKSTIAKLLKRPNSPGFEKCSIDWDNGISREIIVFDKEFREKNIGKNPMPGVYTLGEENIEIKAKIDSLKKDISDCENKIIDFENSKEKSREAFDLSKKNFTKALWEKKKVFDSDFKNAFLGYNNSQEKFKEHILDRYSNKNVGVPVSIDEIRDKAKSIYSNNREKYDSPKVSDIKNRIESLNSFVGFPIWNKKIFGNEDLPIAGLIKHLNNSDWVKQGISYISTGSKVCPFCQQETLTDNFIEELESFFSGEYQKKIQQINSFQNEYQIKANELKNQIQYYSTLDYMFDIGKIDKDFFELKKESIFKEIDNNIRKMKEKEREPSRSFTLTALSYDIVDIFMDAKQKIEDNNYLVDNIEKEKNKLREEVYSRFILDSESEILKYLKSNDSYEKANKSLEEKIKKGRTRIKIINDEIHSLNEKVVNIEETVNEINNNLLSFGFTNFYLKVNPDNSGSYIVLRTNGDKVEDTLSEGEASFISFLYFMKLIKGSTDKKNINENRVVVIDDPVCSLDSSIMFIVSTYVRQLFSLVRECVNEKNRIEQVILLTHNVFFHHEISLDRGKPDRKNRYWIIRKEENISSVNDCGSDNPIKNNYQLLWIELKKCNSLVSIQNIMRRIIEFYFTTLGGFDNEQIKSSFEDPDEKRICSSLFLWMNAGSHMVFDNMDFDLSMETVEKYKSVFKDIFTKTGHEKHYEMMMS